MELTVIIPTFNEEKNIGRLLDWLHQTSTEAVKELIVVDGGSTDKTVALAQKHGGKVLVNHKKGRATQMNFGATNTNAEVLYFLHADVFPPHSWASDIIHAVKNGKTAGCFSYRFDSHKWYLKIHEFGTRKKNFATGGGDQSLFVTREIFELLGGFKEHLCILEDFEFVKRLQKKYPFEIICKDATVSARKYEHNNYLKVQCINFTTVFLFLLGFPQERLAKIYRSLLKIR